MSKPGIRSNTRTIIHLFCNRHTNYLKYVALRDVYQQVLRFPLGGLSLSTGTAEQNLAKNKKTFCDLGEGFACGEPPC